MYKAAVIAALLLYAVILVDFVEVVVDDWVTAADWWYCGNYTSCVSSDCCIQAIAEKEYHLKFD